MELSNDLGRAAAPILPETVFTEALRRRYVFHFILSYGIPGVGLLAAIALLPWLPIGHMELALLGGFYVATAFGITAGFHRHFTHRSFQAVPGMRALLLILGSMAAQGNLISWVGVHRRHHQYSDMPGDPHSPRPDGTSFFAKARGFLHAQIAWIPFHDYPNALRYSPELLKDRLVLKLDRWYAAWVLLGLAIPAAIGGLASASWLGAFTGFLWGGLVRIALLQHFTSAINSLCHMIGARPFAVPGTGGNNAWLALPTLGEAWHNNHHAFPASATFATRWWQIDLGFLMLVTLEKLGLVSQLKRTSFTQYKPEQP